MQDFDTAFASKSAIDSLGWYFSSTSRGEGDGGQVVGSHRGQRSDVRKSDVRCSLIVDC